MSPRRRTKDHDLPPRVYQHGAGYRFVPVDPVTGRNGNPIPLGRNRAEALRKWADLVGEEHPGDARTIAALWERYRRDELPKKATATRAGREQAMKRILDVFGAMPADAIEPHHAVQYLDLRGNVQGNREISALRALLGKAAHWGLIRSNPLAGLRYRNPEPPRERYVTDAELDRAISLAPWPWLKAILWLAYLTGLRRRDLLALTRFQCTEEGLLLTESKTKKRVLIVWTPELRAVIDAALAASPDNRLFPITESAVNNGFGRFQRQLAAAGHERFLLRDLRAKHATDLEDHGGDATAQLGHSARSVTIRHYLRAPRRVVPLR